MRPLNRLSKITWSASKPFDEWIVLNMVSSWENWRLRPAILTQSAARISAIEAPLLGKAVLGAAGISQQPTGPSLKTSYFST